MKEKVKRYLELKEKLKELKKEPIGNRIKKGGPLESRIKQVFKPKRAEKILNRTDSYTFEEWDKLRTEFYRLWEELEVKNIITYDDEGNRIININYL
jgi:hypothetical protein